MTANPSVSRSSLETHKRAICRHQGPILIGTLVATFLIACAVMPLASTPPLVDEPIFASSAFEWARSGDVDISGLSAPLAVFDTIWGGFFARLFGPTHEALRWSTIILTALSAPFFYWLLRQLHASRGVGAVGVAAYLFNPLALVLSVTFMTDMHSAALVTISVALLIRAFKDPRPDMRWLVLAGAVSSIGFLSRQLVLVVPLAGIVVISIQTKSLRAWSRCVVALAGVPVVSYFVFKTWASKEVEPFIRTFSVEALAVRFLPEVGHFLGMAVVMAVVYTGLVALPLAPLLPRADSFRSDGPWSLLPPLAAALIGIIALAKGLDPTLGQAWVSSTGFGGVDRTHLGSRPSLWSDFAQAIILVSAVLVTVGLLRAIALQWPRGRRHLLTLLILTIGGLVAAAVLASLTVHNGIQDRYWAPVIPLTIALVAAVARTSRPRLWIATGVVAVVSLFGLIGTYDALVAQQEIVAFADDAVESGIDALEFEGGASWSAITFGVADDDGMFHIRNRTGPYWMRFYAVETEPRYGVTLEPLDGYRILDRREFQSILHVEPTYVYLVQRPDGAAYFLRKEDF